MGCNAEKNPLRALLLVVAIAAIALPGSVLAVTDSTPGDAQARALLLTQRFRPGKAPRTTALASELVALRGETEGFQAIVRAPSKVLTARLSPSSHRFLNGRVRLYRVGFVRVRRTSTGAGRGAGLYADPLPRLTGAGLETRPGRWAGFAVLVDVPRDAAPGTYAGTIDMLRERGALVAAVPFTLRVSPLVAPAPGDPRAFKAVGGVSEGWYGRAAPVRHPSQVAAQRRGLVAFLAAHRVTPLEWPTDKPSANGTYANSGTGGRTLAESIRLPWRAKFLPSHGVRFSIQKDWEKGGARFIQNVAEYWRARGWIDRNTYFYAWDEPGRDVERRALPAVNRLVHRHAPGVKTFVSTFPHVRQEPRRLCGWRCRVVPGRGSSNRHLWDGGDDDVDAWAVATNRYYGRWTSPLERHAGIDHGRDTWRLLQSLRSRGKEVWSYSYYMPTRRIPQLVIDGAPTDPRLLMLWNGYEGNSGWKMWQLARWIPAKASNYQRTRMRDPYRETLSSITPERDIANGDVSLFYPPIARRYGLTDPLAEPVSSLRFESLRDGIEDADLVALYREKFGSRAVRRSLRPVFGRVRRPAGVGWTWAKYRNYGLAPRLEQVRRRLMERLEGVQK